MDAHHEQVRKRRELARGGPAHAYFAYSTALDRLAFDEWRLQHGYADFVLPEGRLAEARGFGLVLDFPSRFWGGRVAGLEPAAAKSVWGRLFTISAEDWPIVQHKEGAITGMCVEQTIDVWVDGAKVSATAFTTQPARRSFDGPVSSRFLEALVRGASAAGLPGDYLAGLRALG